MMKASRATIRQTKTLARLEEKLDRVLVLLGETPPAHEEDAATLDQIIEELSQETPVEEPAVEEAPVQEEPAEAKPKGKK
jgi:hypothetical protein